MGRIKKIIITLLVLTLLIGCKQGVEKKAKFDKPAYPLIAREKNWDGALLIKLTENDSDKIKEITKDLVPTTYVSRKDIGLGREIKDIPAEVTDEYIKTQNIIVMKKQLDIESELTLVTESMLTNSNENIFIVDGKPFIIFTKEGSPVQYIQKLQEPLFEINNIIVNTDESGYITISGNEIASMGFVDNTIHVKVYDEKNISKFKPAIKVGGLNDEKEDN